MRGCAKSVPLLCRSQCGIFQCVRCRTSYTSSSRGERFVFVPRDRKCLKFNGKSGIGINKWIEEAQACIRGRHLLFSNQAFFLFDHLEGEAWEEIRYCSDIERGNPDKIFLALREVFGCPQSRVALQEAFFSRRQLEGEGLLEFSLALMGLMEKVKQWFPGAVSNAPVLLSDQFVEHVADNTLWREFKQLVRRQPIATFLDVRSEAIRWEQEGMPGGVQARSESVPLLYGVTLWCLFLIVFFIIFVFCWMFSLSFRSPLIFYVLLLISSNWVISWRFSLKWIFRSSEEGGCDFDVFVWCLC